MMCVPQLPSCVQKLTSELSMCEDLNHIRVTNIDKNTHEAGRGEIHTVCVCLCVCVTCSGVISKDDSAMTGCE